MSGLVICDTQYDAYRFSERLSSKLVLLNLNGTLWILVRVHFLIQVTSSSHSIIHRLCIGARLGAYRWDQYTSNIAIHSRHTWSSLRRYYPQLSCRTGSWYEMLRISSQKSWNLLLQTGISRRIKRFSTTRNPLFVSTNEDPPLYHTEQKYLQKLPTQGKNMPLLMNIQKSAQSTHTESPRQARPPKTPHHKEIQKTPLLFIPSKNRTSKRNIH